MIFTVEISIDNSLIRYQPTGCLTLNGEHHYHFRLLKRE